MATITQQLEQLQTDKEILVTKLNEKGVEASNNETFTQLVPKVGSIQSGEGSSTDGWVRPSDWWACETILENSVERDGMYPAYIMLLINDNDSNTFTKSETQGTGYLTSDGVWYNAENDTTTTHIWDKTQDKDCSEGYKTRYVIVYVKNKTISEMITLASYPTLEVVFGNITMNNNINITFYDSSKYNRYIRSVVGTNDFNYTKIGGNMFSECYSLQNVSLPLAKTISGSTFYKCYSLQNVSLPLVTTISSAFSDCHSLQNISLPSLTTISGSAFSYCYSLQNVSLPSLKTISGSNAFNWCLALKEFTFLPTYETINFSNMFLNCYSLLIVNLYDDWDKSGLNLSKSNNIIKQSILDMLSKLKDVTEEGGTYTLTLGTTNLAKLTIEEKTIATNKGWVLN